MPGNSIVRRRSTEVIRPQGRYKSEYYPKGHNSPSNTIQGVSAPMRKFTGTQVTASEGHPWPPRKGSKNDIGGDFSTVKTYVQPFKVVRLSAVKHETNGDRAVRSMNGPIFNTPPNNPTFPTSQASSTDDLDEYGATAIARCKPDNSVANASVFLGELIREGIPSLIGSNTWKSRTKIHKDLGSDYLNAQFGWAPLVNEVRSFGEAIRKSSDRMKQYERDAGKVVRRQFHFPLKRTVSEVTLQTGVACEGPFWQEFYRDGYTGGTLIRRTEVLQRRWFSGAFTYYLPSGYDSRKKMDKWALEAKHMFGLSLTPEVLWNLAPWSWAADWFSNTGDVLANVSSFKQDGLVMRYGYIMEHTIVREIYTNTDPGLKAGPSVYSDTVFVTETKTRRRANPYGFGVSWEGLSAFQLSILGALGISRGR